MRPSPVIILSYLYLIVGTHCFCIMKNLTIKHSKKKQTGWGQPHSQRAALLPGWPDALKDSRFPHGVEFFHGVVLLVEVRIGLFPGLRHPVLRRRTSGCFSSHAQRNTLLLILLWNPNFTLLFYHNNVSVRFSFFFWELNNFTHNYWLPSCLALKVKVQVYWQLL